MKIKTLTATALAALTMFAIVGCGSEPIDNTPAAPPDANPNLKVSPGGAAGAPSNPTNSPAPSAG